MNPYNNTILIPNNNGVDFFEMLRSYIKFSFWVIFFFTLLMILFWNWQPWFEIEIKPVTKAPQATTENTDKPSLQSNVEFINYLVRSGDTLSDIAERNGVGLSELLKFNGIDNSNLVRVGQRLKIPRR